MLECVINVSEGRDTAVIDALAVAAGPHLLDVHTDPDHNRAVLTLAGDGGLQESVRSVTAEGVDRIDLRRQSGAHPRLGAVDVVPFVPLGDATLADALEARRRFTAWVVDTLGVPCFLYGPERSLPEIRRHASVTLAPDAGPSEPHPTAGAICAGARPVLVAYNLWLAAGVGVATARAVAADVRSPAVRALGLDLVGRAQVSLNLVEPTSFGPAEAYDAVASRVAVERAELVGLLPASVLDSIPPERWETLDLHPSRTIEGRLAAPR